MKTAVRHDNAADLSVTANFGAVYATTTKFAASPTSGKSGKTLTLVGTVAAPGSLTLPSGVVTIVKTRLSGKKYVSAGTVKVAVVSGVFRYAFKPSYKTKWHFTATYAGLDLGSILFYSSATPTAKTVTVK